MIKTRRDFLKISTIAGVGALSLPNELFGEEQNSQFDDYKALVIIYQEGGNDGLNTFIPILDDSKKGYTAYANARNIIKIENVSIELNSDGSGSLSLNKGGSNPYHKGFGSKTIQEAYTNGFYTLGENIKEFGLNPLMPELAHIARGGNLAVVANAGNLIVPATKSELLNQKKPKPPFLYAHNHQTKLAFCGESSNLNMSGWAGRLFDRWINVNNGDIYGMNISVSGPRHILYGDETSPLNLSPNGPTKYDFDPNWDETRNKFKEKAYKDFLTSPSRRDIFKNLYTKMKLHSFDMQTTLVDDWKNVGEFSSLNAYGDKIFSKLGSYTLGEPKDPIKTDLSVMHRLESIAKLIKIGKKRGLKRQIFIVTHGGYDNHSNQTYQHSRLLRGLSLGLGDFNLALKEMGLQDSVTTFNISDFGRSTGNNGDGTDHAWGSNLFVMGSAVKGGIYGTLPNLTLGSDDDLTKKGRLIPTTSMTQIYATITKWFGADEDTLDKIFPELKNFTQKDLGFMKS